MAISGKMYSVECHGTKSDNWLPSVFSSGCCHDQKLTWFVTFYTLYNFLNENYDYSNIYQSKTENNAIYFSV